MDRLRRELLALAYSYVESVAFHSEQAGVMAYYNITSLTYYINDNIDMLFFLKHFMCMGRRF